MNEDELVDRLRQGDEDAFALLVDRFHLPMLRLALTFVDNRAVAEDVVQDAWLGVIRGIDRFQRRSSIKTWIFRIVVNRARTRGVRDRRMVSVGEIQEEIDSFNAAGAWISPPQPWADDVIERLFAADVGKRLHGALEELPPLQRQVVTLRDMEGLSSREVCDVLDVTESNQRVLLHRGRSRLRQCIDLEMGET